MEGEGAGFPGGDPGRQRYSVCCGLTGLSSPPPVGFKLFSNSMIKEMKVLVLEVAEHGYWHGPLLDMWESPEPSRREDRACFEAEAKRKENLDLAKVVIDEVNSEDKVEKVKVKEVKKLNNKKKISKRRSEVVMQKEDVK